MSIPAGASRVEYTIHTGDDEPWLDYRFEMPLGAQKCGDILDEAAKRAADYIVSQLGEEFPEARVRASRRYVGRVEGDPWPPREGDRGDEGDEGDSEC